jgi:hypothetical protein
VHVCVVDLRQILAAVLLAAAAAAELFMPSCFCFFMISRAFVFVQPQPFLHVSCLLGGLACICKLWPLPLSNLLGRRHLSA